MPQEDLVHQALRPPGLKKEPGPCDDTAPAYLCKAPREDSMMAGGDPAWPLVPLGPEAAGHQQGVTLGTVGTRDMHLPARGGAAPCTHS